MNSHHCFLHTLALAFISLLSTLTIYTFAVADQPAANKDQTTCADLNAMPHTVIKLSYLGPQNKPVASMIISATRQQLDYRYFKQLGLDQRNDKVPFSYLLLKEPQLCAITPFINQLKADTATTTAAHFLAATVLNKNHTNQAVTLALDQQRSLDLIKHIEQQLDERFVLNQFKQWTARLNL